jgi:hypothetical protein
MNRDPAVILRNYKIIKEPSKPTASSQSPDDSNLNITVSGPAMVYSGCDTSYSSCIPNVGYYCSD